MMVGGLRSVKGGGSVGNEDEVVGQAREELASCYIQLLKMFKYFSSDNGWLYAYVWSHDEHSRRVQNKNLFSITCMQYK